MLSYQHIYHAGNLADVQKHALLAWTLGYLTQKDKPLSYIETHSGRGLYHLDADEAMQTGEAAAGIERAQTEGWFDEGHPLVHVLNQTTSRHGASTYPGSPVIAANLLRSQDSLHLAELHPQEFSALDGVMRSYGAKTYHKDGAELAQSILPPIPRRGMMLIDPSYEVKSDYDRLPKFLVAAHRKWNVGVIALWYPILTDDRHKPMISALEQKDLPKTLRHEVRFPPAREGHRMVGSGMYFVNAPYGIETETDRLGRLFARL